MREVIGLLDSIADAPPIGPLVLAFDPGVSTGWAIYDHQVTAGQDAGEAVLDQFDHYLDRAGPYVCRTATILIESFIIPGQPKVRNIDMTFPIEMIGALKYIARTHEVDEIKMQLPSFRKIASPQLMSRSGWPAYTARDQLSATQHLFSHLLQKNAVPTFSGVVG